MVQSNPLFSQSAAQQVAARGGNAANYTANQNALNGMVAQQAAQFNALQNLAGGFGGGYNSGSVGGTGGGLPGGYQALTNSVLGDLSGAERAGQDQITDQYNQATGRLDQNLIDRGLSNSTVKDALQRGIELDRAKANNDLSSRMAQMRANYRSSIGLSGLGQTFSLGGYGGQGGNGLMRSLTNFGTYNQGPTLPGAAPAQQVIGGRPASRGIVSQAAPASGISFMPPSGGSGMISASTPQGVAAAPRSASYADLYGAGFGGGVGGMTGQAGRTGGGGGGQSLPLGGGGGNPFTAPLQSVAGMARTAANSLSGMREPDINSQYDAMQSRWNAIEATDPHQYGVNGDMTWDQWVNSGDKTLGDLAGSLGDWGSRIGSSLSGMGRNALSAMSGIRDPYQQVADYFPPAAAVLAGASPQMLAEGGGPPVYGYGSDMGRFSGGLGTEGRSMYEVPLSGARYGDFYDAEPDHPWIIPDYDQNAMPIDLTMYATGGE